VLTRILTLAAVCAGLIACGDQLPGGGALATSADSVSYIAGYQIGGSLKAQRVPLQEGAFLRGVRDGTSGAEAALTEEQMRSAVTSYQQQMMTAAAAEGEKFLTENAGKEGVTTTASGLQWKVLQSGRGGAKPKATSEATVHYRGSLPDGTPFDSSYGGDPATFRLNEVIPGWTEAVQLMSPGDKYQVWIPSALAYGEQGRPPVIGPNQPLVFEIELISFK
jgi:FKBP-type peptidyl-prolyl cis-trans isomerase